MNAVVIRSVDGSWYVSGPTRYGTTHPLLMGLQEEQARALADLSLPLLWIVGEGDKYEDS